MLEGYAQMGEWGELSEHTPNVLVATCSYYRMLCIMVRIAKLLGMEQDVIEYKKAIAWCCFIHNHPIDNIISSIFCQRDKYLF